MHTTLAEKKDLQRVTTPELCPLPDHPEGFLSRRERAEGRAVHWTPAAGPLLLLGPRSTEPGARHQPLIHDSR